MAHKVGDDVTIIDTANDRRREGKVREIDGKKVVVFVERFSRDFTFVNGETSMGRFILLDS